MKKTLFTILAGCLVLSAFAQNPVTDSLKSPDGNSLKPARKSVVTELNVNPFKGELSLNNSLNQIKIRVFSSPRFAWRIGFSAAQIDSTLDNSSPYGSNPQVYKSERHSTTLGLNLGFEKHLKGTRRLSPYYGVDLQLSNRSSKQETTQGQQTSSIDGAWVTSTLVYIPGYPNGSYQQVVTSNEQERAYFQYGLNLFTGFDFYMAKNFFVGYEFSFGFRQTDYKRVEVTQTGTPANSPYNGDYKNSSFSLGTSLMNGIRVGYVF